MLQPIKYYFAIETYDWFTDEKIFSEGYEYIKIYETAIKF